MICNDCHIDKPESNFKKVGADRTYRMHRCRSCERKRYRVLNGDKVRAAARRKEHDRIDKYILADSRKTDKKAGLRNDLDREFIRDTIKDGCSYCGETKLRMTLDRIDNEVGHLKTNVVPACIRCNYMRRAMPYEAWLVIARIVREVRLAGLFGEWTGRARATTSSPEPNEDS
jgi:hypothetical protein